MFFSLLIYDIILNSSIGTYSLILRLIKDFGDDTLPFNNGLSPASRGARTTSGTFENIEAEVDFLAAYFLGYEKPGPIWTGPQRETKTNTDLTWIYAPQIRRFSQRWTRDTVSVGRLFNGSILLANGGPVANNQLILRYQPTFKTNGSSGVAPFFPSERFIHI